MSNESHKNLVGVYASRDRANRKAVVSRVARWEFEGLEAVSRKLNISNKRAVAIAIRLLLKNNGINPPEPTPPKSSPVIRIVSMICR